MQYQYAIDEIRAGVTLTDDEVRLAIRDAQRQGLSRAAARAAGLVFRNTTWAEVAAEIRMAGAELDPQPFDQPTAERHEPGYYDPQPEPTRIDWDAPEYYGPPEPIDESPADSPETPPEGDDSHAAVAPNGELASGPAGHDFDAYAIHSPGQDEPGYRPQIKEIEIYTPAAPLAMLDAAEARAIINRIKGNMQTVRADLLELYERKGWAALGYPSWRECAVAEFGNSQSFLYRQLAAAEVDRDLGVPLGATPESHARELSKVDPEKRLDVLARADELAEGQKRQAAHIKQAVQEVIAPEPAWGAGETPMDGVTVDAEPEYTPAAAFPQPTEQPWLEAAYAALRQLSVNVPRLAEYGDRERGLSIALDLVAAIAVGIGRPAAGLYTDLDARIAKLAPPAVEVPGITFTEQATPGDRGFVAAIVADLDQMIANPERINPVELRNLRSDIEGSAEAIDDDSYNHLMIRLTGLESRIAE